MSDWACCARRRPFAAECLLACVLVLVLGTMIHHLARRENQGGQLNAAAGRVASPAVRQR